MSAMPQVGDKNGMLEVVHVEHAPMHKNKPGKITVHCRCECGNTCTVKISAWRYGQKKSCGCAQYNRDIDYGSTGTLRVVTKIRARKAEKMEASLRVIQSVRWVW